VSETAKRKPVMKSRSRDEIFAAMHREMRSWNPQIPESPDRLDPILRVLLQLYANQLAQIDTRIDMVWDVATNSLIRSLCPESMRWPVPAFTVMRCEPVDPVVEIDPFAKFFYREKREGGQTFFFSALRNQRLIAAQIRHIFIQVDNSLVDLSPQTGDQLSTTTSRPRAGLKSGHKYSIFIGIDHDGLAADFTDAAVFLKGMPDVLKQLRWSYWYPGSHFGGMYEDSGFCPGLTTSFEEALAPAGQNPEWGGLRTGTDLFKPLEDSFVILPEKFTSTWEAGPPDEALSAQLTAQDINLPEASEKLYWVRLDLPPGGDKTKLQSAFEIYFNCFIAVNKNELTLFKHTGGNRLVEVELPEDISNILEITSVVDSSGRQYVPRHQMSADTSVRYYTPEERDNRLVLWFDFVSALEMPPDSLTINYSVTAGVAANGIEAGKINDLYENHPGISAAVNIIPTGGAIPAKTEKQIMTEVTARLRNRDRALSFAEISRWAMSFDPRIRSAISENGVERSARGVRRCIVLKAMVSTADFYSDDEAKLLQTRLASFLKARSPVNTHYRVEIVKK
jgi:hypothetical protein